MVKMKFKAKKNYDNKIIWYESDIKGIEGDIRYEDIPKYIILLQSKTLEYLAIVILGSPECYDSYFHYLQVFVILDDIIAPRTDSVFAHIISFGYCTGFCHIFIWYSHYFFDCVC